MFRTLLATSVFFVAMLCISNASAATNVSSARVWPAPDYTRIAIESDKPISYKTVTLSNPDRLVLDLEEVDLSPALKGLSDKVLSGDPYIKQVRVGKFKPGVIRLVIDLKAVIKPNIFTLQPAGEYKHRLVVDVYPAKDPLLALLEQHDKTSEKNKPMASATTSASNVSNPNQINGMQVSPTIVTPITANPENSVTPSEASNTNAANPPSETKPVEVKPTETKSAEIKTPESKTLDLKLPEPKPAETKSSDTKIADTKPAEVKPAEPKTAETVTNIPPQEPKPVFTQTIKNKEDARLITIAIDAGHGGEDPGARGANGSNEKDITLAVAKKLKEAIDNEPNMRGILTRDGDYFIPLHGRVVKARNMQADLFISIHADAFVRPDARGSSVFALSERGATSASARYLAKKENESDLIGGVSLDDKDPYLAKTLLDLSQTATINDSLKLAKHVLMSVSEVNSLHKGSVEQAGFAVLKSPDIPSILVETAFISNPQEESKLNDEDYQRKLVKSILAGVKKYFASNPALAKTKMAKQ